MLPYVGGVGVAYKGDGLIAIHPFSKYKRIFSTNTNISFQQIQTSPFRKYKHLFSANTNVSFQQIQTSPFSKYKITFQQIQKSLSSLFRHVDAFLPIEVNEEFSRGF